jgi:RHS repeat-associated protein
LSDRLSTRAVLDASGNIVGRQGHLPFGEESGTSGEQEKHRFTSYERDSESGLDYAVNRGYSANIGRFLQADSCKASSSAENPKGWNRYAYVENNPTNAVDPLGLFLSVGLDDFFPCDGSSMLGSLLCLPLAPFSDIWLPPIINLIPHVDIIVKVHNRSSKNVRVHVWGARFTPDFTDFPQAYNSRNVWLSPGGTFVHQEREFNPFGEFRTLEVPWLHCLACEGCRTPQKCDTLWHLAGALRIEVEWDIVDIAVYE